MEEENNVEEVVSEEAEDTDSGDGESEAPAVEDEE